MAFCDFCWCLKFWNIGIISNFFSSDRNLTDRQNDWKKWHVWFKCSMKCSLLLSIIWIVGYIDVCTFDWVNNCAVDWIDSWTVDDKIWEILNAFLWFAWNEKNKIYVFNATNLARKWIFCNLQSINNSWLIFSTNSNWFMI